MKTSTTLIALLILAAVITACNRERLPVEGDQPGLSLQPTLSPPSDEIQFDYHEVHGTVRIEDYPAGNPGDDLMAKLAPVVQGKDVHNIEVQQATWSGPGLTEHIVNGQQIFVWHDYQDTPVDVITVTYTDGSGDLTEEDLMVRKPCFNWLGGWLTPVGDLLRWIFG